jgi:uncharacterized protein YecT (DUF1311 family)
VSKPIRVFFSVLGAALVIGAVLAFVLPIPDTTVTAGVTTTTTVPCSSSVLESDVQIDQCLKSTIRVKTAQMETSLRDESVFFHYASKVQDWRVAQRTQTTFMSYARQECLTQANPYQPGTIVPIIYGECVIGFYNQRLTDLRDAIASFKRGGEAQATS